MLVTFRSVLLHREEHTEVSGHNVLLLPGMKGRVGYEDDELDQTISLLSVGVHPQTPPPSGVRKPHKH